jgi:membrane associated rhomboid family serine protease
MSDASFRQDVENQPPNGNQPLLSLPGPVAWLVGLLVAIFLIPPLFINNWDVVGLFYFAFIPGRFFGSVAYSDIPGAAYWPFLTHALLHVDTMHLTANCLWLAVFGTPVARCLGSGKFVAVATAAAIAGALSTFVVRWGANVPMLGASGIVAGMVGASVPITFAPNAIYRLRAKASPEYFSIMPFSALMQHVPALTFMAVFLAVTLFTGATQFLTTSAFLSENQVAWEAHLGGFLAGLALIYVLAPNRR